MSNQTSRVRFSDILILPVLVFLTPWTTDSGERNYGIGDKTIIYYTPHVPADKLDCLRHCTDGKLAEMDYYFKVHNATDDGYNLIADYRQKLRKESVRLRRQATGSNRTKRNVRYRQTIKATDRPLTSFFTANGYWHAGHYRTGRPSGSAIGYGPDSNVVCTYWENDSIVLLRRYDSEGTYTGQADRHLNPHGQGTYDYSDGSHYEGLWSDGLQNGFGFFSSSVSQLRVGLWRHGRFLGEKMKYTSERIYGIDVSRHQHEKGRRRYAINWQNLLITSLGRRHDAGGQTFPVSFAYIKATEGTSVRNRYFAQDYNAARRCGIKTGAYHFYSLQSSPHAQAVYFLRNSIIKTGDFPPVLDVEPTDAQIARSGGAEALLNGIRKWLEHVEQQTGTRPILYVNQMFVNKYLADAPDIKQKYNVWIARYGEYRPDVKLAFWQLSPEGSVKGITGPVDINVFNGYRGQYDEFLRNSTHQ